MKSPICDQLGIEFPLVAFTHCRDVVCEVSKAGGMGVLGAAGYSPEQLEIELKWIDEHIDGMPYGVDLIVPTSMANKDESASAEEIEDLVPDEHKQFASSILARHQIDTGDLYQEHRSTVGRGFLGETGAASILDVAFAHPIKLIANALGVPPRYMLELGKQHNVPVAALVGAKSHAVKQAEAGVDILVVAGTEAGGHCGEVSTMVLVPEVCDAVKHIEGVSVLAAGGIVTGRQMAASMAMGAHGKYSRQIRSPWTDAWESGEAPEPLPMPLQSQISEPALGKVTKLAEGGHAGAKQLATFWVGQGVGLMNQSLSSKQVVYDFMEDFLAANERLKGFVDE